MAENSKIEWCDHTFNPWVGCTKVSPACDHCYAEGWAKRTGQAHLWDGDRRRTSSANWRQPILWNRKAEATGARAKVFCASLADVFDNQANSRWRDDLWHLIDRTPFLDWLLLTKRPQNIRKMLPGTAIGAPEWGEGWPNVWLGTTVENQEEADRRIPHLLGVPARVRFLSCEPLLGPVDLSPWLSEDNGCQGCDDGEGYGNRCSRTDIPRNEQCPWIRAVQTIFTHGPFDADGCPTNVTHRVETLDWVIAGYESGPKARPRHPDLVRSLRDQCLRAGVPFFFKQWGEWAPGDAFGMVSDGPITDMRTGNVRDWMKRYVVCADRADRLDGHSFTEHGTDLVYRVGKARAGAMLDGREWREMPHD